MHLHGGEGVQNPSLGQTQFVVEYSILKFSFEGSGLLQILKSLVENADRYDVVYEELHSFHREAKDFDNMNNSDSNRVALVMLNKKIVELKTLLSDKSSFEPRAGTDQCQNTSQRQSPSSALVFFHQFSPLKPDVAFKVQCLICSKILESSRGFFYPI